MSERRLSLTDELIRFERTDAFLVGGEGAPITDGHEATRSGTSSPLSHAGPWHYADARAGTVHRVEGGRLAPGTRT